jgi:hypothetical protein
MELFFWYFLPKFVYIPLPWELDASSKLKVNFYSIILELFSDLVTMKLLYFSIQFYWHFPSFTSKYSSCNIFSQTHSVTLAPSVWDTNLKITRKTVNCTIGPGKEWTAAVLIKSSLYVQCIQQLYGRPNFSVLLRTFDKRKAVVLIHTAHRAVQPIRSAAECGRKADSLSWGRLLMVVGGEIHSLKCGQLFYREKLYCTLTHIITNVTPWSKGFLENSVENAILHFLTCTFGNVYTNFCIWI